MNTSEYATPQKLPSHQSHQQLLVKSVSNYETSNISSSKRTTGSFHLLPFIHTPPSRRLKKVINPFEHALTDRLHLPLICSPSLFKPPSTPKNKSLTQFEWTIDDVSSLTPANVEPHETQFLETSPDPELEAKAQAAIRSYFKEQLIVPSPSECPIKQRVVNRKTEILVSENFASSSTLENVNSKLLNKKLLKARSRNVITQTMLSLPPILPIEVENVLKKYLTLENCKEDTNNESIEKSVIIIDDDCNNMTIDHQNELSNSKDVSRRLFDRSMSEEKDNIEDIKTPQKNMILKDSENVNISPINTPDLLDSQPLIARNSGNLIDKNTSLEAISPISKLESSNCDHDDNDNNTNSPHFPFLSSSQKLIFKTVIISSPNKNEEFKDEDKLENCNDDEMSIYRSACNQSLNQPSTSEVSMNMSVDISISGSQKELPSRHKHNHSNKKNMMIMDEENLFGENDGKMHISQLSSCSSSSNSSVTSQSSFMQQKHQQQHHTETPVKKRYPSRKNLSHSFLFHLEDDDEDIGNNEKNINKENCLPQAKKFNGMLNIKEQISKVTKVPSSSSQLQTSEYITGVNEKSSILYPIDSGFNEITCLTQDESKFTNDLKMRCGLLDKIHGNEDINENDVVKWSSSPLIADVSMTDVTSTETAVTVKNNSSPMRCCSTPSKRINDNSHY